MEHRTRIRRIALALLLTAVSPAVRAQTAPGLADFQAGRVAEAVSAWNAAATAGDATAALYLGVMYDTGFGVPADRDQAMRWYRAAADAGNATAMFNLAVLYDGHRPSGAGPDQAIPWYLKAAQNGVGRADYNLGLIYEGGDGVPIDRARAITFYTAAARHGVPANRRRRASTMFVATSECSTVPPVIATAWMPSNS